MNTVAWECQLFKAMPQRSVPDLQSFKISARGVQPFNCLC
jgi:hypothetical protein